jgi:hypothetical protein
LRWTTAKQGAGADRAAEEHWIDHLLRGRGRKQLAERDLRRAVDDEADVLPVRETRANRIVRA